MDERAHSHRQLVNFGPDHAETDDGIVVLSEGNRLGIRPQGDRNWGMTVEILQVGGSLVHYAVVRPGIVQFEAPSEPDDVTLFFTARGKSIIEIEGSHRCEIEKGSAFFYRSGVRGTARWPVESAFIGVRVPAEALAEMGVEPDTPCGKLDTGGFLSQPAVSFLKSVASNKSTSTALSAYFVERLVQELVGSFFLSHTGVESERVPDRTHLYQRAISLMTAKRADPTLTAKSVATDLNVSLRQLQREFQSRGSSPAGQIRKLRIDLAAQLLQNRAYDALTIEQIAQYSGLSSAQQLRASLASAGCLTPMRIREGSLVTKSIVED